MGLSPRLIVAIALVTALLIGVWAASSPTSADAANVNKTVKKLSKKVNKLNKQVKRANKKVARAITDAAKAVQTATEALENGGPQGPAGPEGPKGEDGAPGADGADGADGESVHVTAEPPGGNCPDAGQKLTSADGTAYVCNGANGQTGFTDTLPLNKTETGLWSFATTNTAVPDLGAPVGTLLTVPLSFNIPLAASLDGDHVVYVENGGSDANCPGTAAEPDAASGYLCVYESGALNDAEPQGFFPVIAGPNGAAGAGISGARLAFSITGPTAIGGGTWAVTG